jgi:transposase
MHGGSVATQMEQRPVAWEMPDQAFFQSKQLYNTIREYSEQIKRFNNQLHGLQLLPVVSQETIQSLEKMKGQLQKEMENLEGKLDLAKSMATGTA